MIPSPLPRPLCVCLGPYSLQTAFLSVSQLDFHKPYSRQTGEVLLMPLDHRGKQGPQKGEVTSAGPHSCWVDLSIQKRDTDLFLCAFHHSVLHSVCKPNTSPRARFGWSGKEQAPHCRDQNRILRAPNPSMFPFLFLSSYTPVVACVWEEMSL